MPPTPIPSGFGIASVLYERLSDGHTYVTTWGFTNGPGADPVANATSIASAWIGNFLPAHSLDSYEFTGVRVLQNRGGVEEAGIHIDATVGTATGNPVSPAVAVGITKQTQRAGRKYRGRVYLPPAFLPEEDVDDAGVIDPGVITTLQADAVGWLGDMNTADLDLTLLHKDLSTPTLIYTLEVRPNVRTQRRRQRLA